MTLDIRRDTKRALALLGRPNVGKSTLFNRLTRTRDALVADTPGVTRDVKVGVGKLGSASYLVVDTGGIDDTGSPLAPQISQQALLALKECECGLLLIDGRDGITGADRELARQLRKSNKPLYLAVNKTEGHDPETITAEFAELGLNPVFAISASHGSGVVAMIEEITAQWVTPEAEEGGADDSIRVAICGRPNVGKSTLANRMLGEQRMITADLPGTTHDSVAVPMERHGHHYTLIDTAGLRRKSKVTDVVEKFSAIKSLQAIDLAHVVVVVLDAREGLSEQDLTVLGSVVECGRSLVIAVNKWDGLSPDLREAMKSEMDRRLDFVDFATVHTISALHGTGVGDLFDSIDAAWRSAHIEVPTKMLTELLEVALDRHNPPLVRGRRIKLRYAHFGAKNPPTIIIHGSQTDEVPVSYQRYLSNFFRSALKLVGTPVRIQFKYGDNPFKGRHNPLTRRQVQKRQRLVRHTKK
ncbi:MAG: ribosome biogenesis GTPase Der [Gammaproteobacteria bacterium]|nr:ribosome biogenesis GTPase Der [Gammaproteobacteria bacterium]